MVGDRWLHSRRDLATCRAGTRFIVRTRCRTLAVQASDGPSSGRGLGSDQRALCRPGERQIGHRVLSTRDGRAALRRRLMIVGAGPSSTCPPDNAVLHRQRHESQVKFQEAQMLEAAPKKTRNSRAICRIRHFEIPGAPPRADENCVLRDWAATDPTPRLSFQQRQQKGSPNAGSPSVRLVSATELPNSRNRRSARGEIGFRLRHHSTDKCGQQIR